MNEHPFPNHESDSNAFGAGPDEPLPTIEPGMVELAAGVDNPVIDVAPAPGPAMPAQSDAIDFIPASLASLLAPEFQAPARADPVPDGDLASQASRPISTVMDRTLWTVHAEDSIERVEEILTEQHLSSAPVVGSNGAIVGMIGQPELMQFHAEGKNAKAVKAWEISRIRNFEVSPADTVEDVAKLMSENKVETISVTEFGQLKGIVSTQDLLQEMLRVLPDEGSR